MTTETQNSLANASSSYLRTAMHQPIRWNEWNHLAFERARQENKPVLLDIGAVWCHWCHVMDRESYDNPEIAAIINEHFVAIKVDRDERPDVDSRYQSAVAAISGQGGWPLTAFLTPEGHPFFGGTYFPPDDQYGRPGFRRILLSIANAYREKHSEVMESAESAMSAISHAESFAGRSGEISPQGVDHMIATALQMFDSTYGGFGSQPKFPHSAIVDLLIDNYAHTGKKEVATVIHTTLTRMALGGIYDQLAGGFHRYSVDEKWLVPHFEKMSYDNSELLKNYLHAYQATGDEFYAQIARDIIRWIDEWLSDRERGGFYASQDADYSMDDDGDYFTWTLEEARAILQGDELEVAVLRYDIGEVGEMHHNHAKNVLHVSASIEQIALRLKKDAPEIQALLDSAKTKMLAARVKRPTPYVDKTVYVNWNALCISAYLQAARALGLTEVRHFALKSLDRLLAEAWNPAEGLSHVIAYSDPKAAPRRVTGLLDDYAFLVTACLDAYEATSDLSYYRFAEKIAGMMLDRFFDETGGGFFDSPQGNTSKSASPSPPASTTAQDSAPEPSPLPSENSLGALATRRKPLQDSPTPAGNPAAAVALLRLHGLSNNKRYWNAAEETLEAFAGIVEQFGIFVGTYGIALNLYSRPHEQAVIIGEDAVADELYRAALRPFRFGRSVLRFARNEIIRQNLPPALAETLPGLPLLGENRSAAILCSGLSCQPPMYDPAELQRQPSIPK